MNESRYERLRQAAQHLYNWQTFGGTNFHAMLYELMAKADVENFARLIQGFPDECAVFLQWRHAAWPELVFMYYRVTGKGEGAET